MCLIVWETATYSHRVGNRWKYAKYESNYSRFMAQISTYPKASTFSNIPVRYWVKRSPKTTLKSILEQICKALRSSGVDSFSRGLAVWTEWLCFRTHVTSSYIEISNGECPPLTNSDLVICVWDKSLYEIITYFISLAKMALLVISLFEHPLRIHMVTICETQLMHELPDPTHHAMFLVAMTFTWECPASLFRYISVESLWPTLLLY